jgi:hypothetical protein
MRRVAFAVPVYRDHAEPMSELNITPLIDVMLVLLVMFILVLPAATHQVPIDLPQPGPSPELPVDTHRLMLARAGGGRGGADPAAAGDGEEPAGGAGDAHRSRGAVRALRPDTGGGEARGGDAVGVRGECGVGGVAAYRSSYSCVVTSGCSSSEASVSQSWQYP